MNKIGADAVAYVPTAVSPFKTEQISTPSEQRVAMLRLALANDQRAVVITTEVDRHDVEPSYTVDTLEAMHRELGDAVGLRFFMGGDQLRVFDQWRSYRQVIELAEPLVVVRPPYTSEMLLASLPRSFDAQVWAQRLIELPQINVSSSKVRARVAAGKPITGMVVPPVEEYIHQHGLYRGS